jgi:phosphatidylserine/phosphatidylglycerophosphate/cardiolipin synthase-like enzyme
MAKFLTTRGTTSQLEDIINTAQKELVLISPFIRIPETLFQCVQDTDRRNVSIKIVYGKSELQQEVMSQLKQLHNLSLYFNKDLHAKCFCNESSMIITSMNLYDYSELHNREMGILITASDDKNLYDEAVKEVERIVNFSEQIDLRKYGSKHSSATYTQSISHKPTAAILKGFCIRCKKSIPYDFGAPYCPACYKVWKKWKNPNHEEKHCHLCGKQTTTTLDYPLCRGCYRKSQR